jgi:hypothetical protein
MSKDLFENLELEAFGSGELFEEKELFEEVPVVQKEETSPETKSAKLEIKSPVEGELLEESESETEETSELDTTNETSNEESEESEIYKVFANTLKDEGVLSESTLEEFDGTIEGLMSAMGKEIELEVTNYKESLPDVIKDLIDNYEEGVPLDRLIESKSRQIEYSNITEDSLEDNLDLQKQILKNNLLSKGIKEVKADKMIRTFEDTGDLFDEAKDALSELKEQTAEYEQQLKEQTKKHQEETKKRNAEIISGIEKTIDSTTEIVPGIKLTAKERKELFSMMTKPVGTDERGNPINKVMQVRSQDPVKFDMILNEMLRLGAFEGKWDKIVKTAKTEATKQLANVIQSSGNKFTAGKDKISTGGKNPLLDSLRKNK